MIKISKLVELPIVCGALLQSPKLPLRAFPFLSLQKANRIIVKGMKRKISPSSPEGQGWVKNPEHFIGGSILLSKGGSVQMSVKDRRSLCACPAYEGRWGAQESKPSSPSSIAHLPSFPFTVIGKGLNITFSCPLSFLYLLSKEKEVSSMN